MRPYLSARSCFTANQRHSRRLNGLPDGLGVPLEALESVLNIDSSTGDIAQRQVLENMRESVEGVIRRP